MIKKFNKALSIGFVLIITSVAGCAGTSSKTNQLSLGMSKPDAIAAMGDPTTSRAVDGTEYLVYKLTPGTGVGKGVGCAFIGFATFGAAYAMDDDCTGGKAFEFFLQFKESKLVSYGRVGDFDSTKNPTININKTTTIK
jgi:hypothetical protein